MSIWRELTATPAKPLAALPGCNNEKTEVNIWFLFFYFFFQINRKNKMSKLLQLPLWPQQQTRSIHLHHRLWQPAKPWLAALRLKAKLLRDTVQVSTAEKISQSLNQPHDPAVLMKTWKVQGTGSSQRARSVQYQCSKMLTGWHYVKWAGNFTSRSVAAVQAKARGLTKTESLLSPFTAFKIGKML